MESPDVAGRRAFDELSLRMTEVKKSSWCSKVRVCERPPISAEAIMSWHQEHQPCILPDDYKTFLEITDGVSANWSLRLGSDVSPYGVVNINRLDLVKPFPDAKVKHFVGRHICSCNGKTRAFDLDAECQSGHVALVFFCLCRRTV